MLVVSEYCTLHMSYLPVYIINKFPCSHFLFYPTLEKYNPCQQSHFQEILQ